MKKLTVGLSIIRTLEIIFKIIKSRILTKPFKNGVQQTYVLLRHITLVKKLKVISITIGTSTTLTLKRKTSMRWRVYFLYEHGFANVQQMDVWALTKVRAYNKVISHFKKYGLRIYPVNIRRLLWFTK